MLLDGTKPLKYDPNIPIRKHPATFNDKLLRVIGDMIKDKKGKIIFDPFAGVGTIGKIYKTSETVGVEREIEWANQGVLNLDRSFCDDFLSMPFRTNSINVCITSPTYANRLADKYIGKNKESDKVRRTYVQYLDRMLSENNSGALKWDERYRFFHRKAWRKVFRMMVSSGRGGPESGLMVLNVKDHIRDGELCRVSLWHKRCLEGIGFRYLTTIKIDSRGDQNTNRNASNGKPIVDHENVFLFQKP